MTKSPGFYKFDDILFYGPNSVAGPDLHLIKEEKTLYTYPVQGWYWFDSEVEAREFFGLPPNSEEEQDSWPTDTLPSK